MESSSPADDGLSPESTVTSLLSSSGHLRSSLRPPELNSTIRYRNKDYDSASAALDAYIEDFERSCQNCRSLTGSLVLPRDPPSTPTRPRGGSLRNRDVLQERLTDRELDFLKLPVSSLRHRGNRDRLSMTTDELLSIPYDGSMPVTHTSAFIQGLLSLAAASQSLPSSTRPAHRTRTGLGSRADPLNLDQNPVPSRSRGPEDMLSSAADSSSAQRAADLHLPRWLTSNKSLMDGSEISSLPDLKHPAWIRRCDGSEPDPWDERESRLRGENGAGAPSWVSELEKDDEADQTPAQDGSQATLRDVRLELAEQISLLAAGGRGSDGLSVLFAENRIGSLIQKADRVLDSLSQTSDRTESPAGPAAPGSTEDLLLSPPPRRPPFSPDSVKAAAAGGLVEVWSPPAGPGVWFPWKQHLDAARTGGGSEADAVQASGGGGGASEAAEGAGSSAGEQGG
ncbi:lung adenoma susceptibility protein 2 isoform X2 [Kryptolebias marmoratus]|uniref:lung adenoma susceptibility protein 2 isoform X2 n=1 Tax=Kryptolebias marmoratus TaxID=37003 RepID=UPI000D52F93A|nr:lung adenoma susceptibility protein 2 isoform X2 [Kryptolebias marmoratus]